MTPKNKPEFDRQTEVFDREVERLMWGTDDEFRGAADAIVATVTGSRTGYTLACGLADVAAALIERITNLGQVPITEHQPQSQSEVDDIMLASRFMQAAHARMSGMEPENEKPETLVIFQVFETDETGRSLAGLYGFLMITIRDLGQQVKQALVDAEGRS